MTHQLLLSSTRTSSLQSTDNDPFRRSFTCLSSSSAFAVAASNYFGHPLCFGTPPKTDTKVVDPRSTPLPSTSRLETTKTSATTATTSSADKTLRETSVLSYPPESTLLPSSVISPPFRSFRIRVATLVKPPIEDTSSTWPRHMLRFK